MRRDVVRGALAGALAGMVASYAMEEFQKLWSAAQEKAGGGRDSGDDEDPSTVKAADRVSRAATGHPVAPDKREAAGEAVHYVTGAGVGAVYGALAEIAPAATFGFGAAYGGAVALGLDEAAVPALGLSKGPLETPASTHVYGLVSHLVYGVVLEASRRLIRALL